ncbi:PR-1-like protein, partial [Lentithecium fluviatile CBS 122367]
HESGEIQATFSEGQDYINAVLWHHNRARANHGASNLEWSEDCVAGAEKAAATCVFEHLITDGQGQNLYATSGDAYNVTAGITDAFYKAEADLYTYWGKEPPHNATNPEMLDETIFHAWGHLTQVLWKETTHVGCKTVNCPSMGTNRYTVCNYYPAGNVASQFAANVAAPDASYAGYSWLD